MEKETKLSTGLKDDEIVKKERCYWILIVTIWVLLIKPLLFTGTDGLWNNFAAILMLFQSLIHVLFFVNVFKKYRSQFDEFEFLMYGIVVPIFYVFQMAILTVNGVKISHLIASLP